jgi:hypothetical protein
LLIFFITLILALSKSELTVSTSSIIAETDNFKEEEFTNLWHKSAKKVSMLTEYFGDRCSCRFFFISPTFVLHESAPTVSISSIIAETDNFEEEEFATLWHKAAKKVSMFIAYLGD